ncbi:hydroxysteroid 11-beta-dehydrogenase 1-like protein [Protopterus annectens]|uniref:hydroxysteroid 11-beta-dehydrogenase 1-like protein n=1 Tax=Protopterus annectens TaxID=7888 RepID=UPI001CFA4CC5|nr:hydroxysteroid 11-beta-dehydrogenase 1-like protein [Protopterus annectens]
MALVKVGEEAEHWKSNLVTLATRIIQQCRQRNGKKLHRPPSRSRVRVLLCKAEFNPEKWEGDLPSTDEGDSDFEIVGIKLTVVTQMKLYALFLFQVNFFSYVQLTTVAIPVLSENNGSIVVVSSLLGKIPNPFVTSYAASKFALEGFFGSLRHEIAMQRQDVSITLCILGLIDTKSAMDKIRGMVSLNAYPASESALAIIKGAARRERDVFYPWWTRLLCCIKEWFPEYQDRIIRNTYNYTIKEEN